MRARDLGILGLLSTTLAIAIFVWSTGDTGPTPEMRQAARTRIQAAAAPLPRFDSGDRPQPDWDALADADDVAALLESDGPAPDWPEHEILAFHKELTARGLLGNDIRTYFPWFLCDRRCTPAANRTAAWPGTRMQCMEQCSLDRLGRLDTTDAAVFATVVAQRSGNVALYEDLVLAYPDLWEQRRQRIADGRPRGIAAVWWGDAMRARAPGIQQSLYTFGRQTDGHVGGLALMASGWTACVTVAEQTVCP